MNTADPRLVALAQRLLAGERIDWDKEGIAESEVREGMKRLQKVVGLSNATESADASPPPSRDRFIGEFRLVRKLGEGGMGVVYEAEQQHPRRPVGLKVIRGGRHVDAHALRLFQREIQTLARLGHPGIAQLYEAGVTDEGMHFFAMELVRGESLSEWLKKRGTGPVSPVELKLRLGLFRKICDAVAYAHQKGVIHRDLKPGNILIPKAQAGSSVPDAVPEVKILDFGLARMTDTDVQMTTFVTEIGKVQGTLPYMSPEQIRGNPDEIDLRTDVYSLGVILYELVTGKLPLDVSKAQLPDAMRIICEEAPRSISATFSGTRRLDADVATIAGKCLEKETARRYQSAAALAEDVQRYLSDQPIQARPPSAAYQFRKLVLRHKLPFAFAGAVFVLLAVFAAAMTVQSIRVAREAETSRRVSNFLEELFKASDPWQARDRPVSPREVLDAAAERIRTELAGEPEIQARLMRTIGIAYRRLGFGSKGTAMLEDSLKLVKRIYGEESLQYADLLLETAGQFNLKDQVRAHEIYARLLKPDDPRMARSLYYVGTAKWLANRAREGEADLRRALEIIDRTDHPDEQLHLWALNDLGIALCNRKEYRDGIPLLRQAQDIRERIYHEDHGDRINGLNNLGFILMLAGERQEARRYLEAALTAQERAFGPDSGGLIFASLGELERQEGNLDKAKGMLERSLLLFDKANTDPMDSVRTDSLVSLALIDEQEGRLDDAIRHFGRAYEIYRHFPGIAFGDPSVQYARVLRKAGRVTEAQQVEAAIGSAGAKP